MANGKKTDQQRIEAAERRQQVLELRKQRQSFRAIGAELGISEAQAHRDYKAAMARLVELEEASADELRTMELAILDTLAVEALRVLEADHPYVSGGKVLRDVTDDGPKLAAIAELRRISESRRKLLGLDKPTLTALTNPDGSPYTGDYAVLRAAVLAVLAPYPDLRIQIAAQLAALPEPSDADDQPTT